MNYGERELRRGCEGPDVAELRLRLAGFRGTLPDGDFGPGTERQVMNFRRDYMRLPQQSGRAEAATLRAIDEFGGARDEAHHLYEYPGMHRMLLWAVRAAFFYMPEHRFTINSGYRCSADGECNVDDPNRKPIRF